MENNSTLWNPASISKEQYVHARNGQSRYLPSRRSAYWEARRKKNRTRNIRNMPKVEHHSDKDHYHKEDGGFCQPRHKDNTRKFYLLQYKQRKSPSCHCGYGTKLPFSTFPPRWRQQWAQCPGAESDQASPSWVMKKCSKRPCRGQNVWHRHDQYSN